MHGMCFHGLVNATLNRFGSIVILPRKTALSNLEHVQNATLGEEVAAFLVLPPVSSFFLVERSVLFLSGACFNASP